MLNLSSVVMTHLEAVTGRRSVMMRVTFCWSLVLKLSCSWNGSVSFWSRTSTQTHTDVSKPTQCGVNFDTNRSLTFHKFWLHSKLEGDLQPLGYVPDLSHQFVVVFILVGKISSEKKK